MIHKKDFDDFNILKSFFFERREKGTESKRIGYDINIEKSIYSA